MAERNVILRLESVVAGSVGRAFKTVTTNVDEIQKEFDQAKLAVSETTREMKRLQREGKDISDVERRLEEAQRATKRWREELQTARARLDRVAQAGKRLDSVASALNKVNIASGIFTAALGFGLNEINQQILEMGEAVNRAGLQFDEGSRLILAAQKAGSRDASGFVEELKEIPRALQEAYESQEKLNALQQLGLDPDRLLGLDRVSQFEAILDAVRNTSLDSRQYLLETAGLTGLFADQMLQFANLSESAFQQFRTDLRSGRAVTLEQYQAQQEFNASIAEFRQELLLGGIEILKTYLPAIKAIIGAMTEGVGWVLEFIAQNKELVIILGSAAVSIATVTLAIKAARTAVLLFAGAQKALAAASVIGWTNPFLAAIAAIGIALAGVIWLLSRFKKTTEEVNRTQLQTPDYASGLDRASVDRAAAGYRAQAQADVDALALGSAPTPTGPTVRPLARPASTGGGTQIVNNIQIDIEATFAGAAELATEVGDRLATELDARLRRSARGANG